MTEQPSSRWAHRAEALVEKALGELRDGHDAISTLSAAVQALRIEAGEVDPDSMAAYPFPGEEDDESGCICTPQQRATGGFTSRCPVHGALLSEDAERIKLVPDRERRAWEPKPTGYGREQYEADRLRRDR